MVSVLFVHLGLVLRSLLETSNILRLGVDVSGCSSELTPSNTWVFTTGEPMLLGPNSMQQSKLRILILQRIGLCCRYHSKNFPPFIKNSGVRSQLCILYKIFGKVFSVWLFPEGHTEVAMGVCLCRQGSSTHTFCVSPIFHWKKR